ncbi:MAG: metallophosphoesterase [Firmicutes bacterium]|nr:metallophosphoesterase [Bacillota bacterium]
MSIFVISDLHLSLFPGADKPMDIFGARWYDHPGRLERAWRESIKEGDTVLIPGDTSWALKLEDAKYDLDWVAALPGRKILLKGNHDLWWTGITKLNKMYDNMTFLQNDHVFAEGCYICGSRGWLTPDSEDFTEADEKIYRRELLRLESSLKSAAAAREAAPETASAGEAPIIGLLHYPPVSDARRYSGFQQLFEDYGVKDVYYGHVHGEDGFRTRIQGELHGVRYHLVSLDYLDAQPLQIR